MTGQRRPREHREVMWTDGFQMQIQPVLRDDNPWNSNNVDEPLWWPRTMWIDPGVVSGVAVAWFDPQALVSGQPLPRCVLAIGSAYLNGPENLQAAMFVNAAVALDQTPGLALGVESFVIGKFSQDEAFLSPVRIRAALDFHFFAKNRRLWSQSPSDAKGSVTDARLKLWNMYVAGPDHQRDARRHALLWLKKLRSESRETLVRLHGNEAEWWEESAEQEG